MSALRLAAHLGYRGVEFDVKLSADGVPVLMHDDTLERTTSGHGPVAAATFGELGKLDAGARFHRAFSGEPVPTFEAAARICQSLGLWANVEIKPCPGREAETGAIVAKEAQRLWSEYKTPPLLSSFAVDALRAARDTAPQLPHGLLVVEVPQGWRALVAELGCVALHVQHEHVTPDLVQAVHDAGHGLLCYTVNDATRASELRAIGVDCLVTDRLDLFQPGSRVNPFPTARSKSAPTRRR